MTDRVQTILSRLQQRNADVERLGKDDASKDMMALLVEYLVLSTEMGSRNEGYNALINPKTAQQVREHFSTNSRVQEQFNATVMCVQEGQKVEDSFIKEVLSPACIQLQLCVCNLLQAEARKLYQDAYSLVTEVCGRPPAAPVDPWELLSPAAAANLPQQQF